MAQDSDKTRLTLRIVTPQGVAFEERCDSVTLILMDNESGTGGGSIGIRRGHAPAMLALAPGPIQAKSDGKPLLKALLEAGTASVADNVVTVLTDALQIQ